MPLWARLYLAMIAVALLAAAATGFVAIYTSERNTVHQALGQASAHAELLASQLNAPVDFAKDDLRALSRTPPLVRIAQGGRDGIFTPGTDLNHWRELLQSRFVSEMRAKPLYLQMRLIAANGAELVRVNRVGPHSLRAVARDDLQIKADRPYFQSTIHTPANQIYVSKVELNVEHGVIETPHVPVVRVGMPIYADASQPIGILIINIDMRPLFAALQRNAPPHSQVFLINRRGYYLSGPDPAKTFAFDTGGSSRIQADHPPLAAIVGKDRPSASLLDLSEGPTAVIAQPFRIGEGPLLSVVAMTPESQLLSVAGPIKRSIILGGGITGLAAIAIALALSYSLSRPIKQLTEQVQRWPVADPDLLPVGQTGEIGVLARALAAYAKSERFAEATIVSSSDAILTKTLDGIVTSWNPAAVDLLGYSAEEAIGRNVELIVPEDRRAQHDGHMEEIRAGKQVRNIRTARRSKDGRIIEVSLTLSPVRLPNGQLIGASSIAHDITDRLARERRLKEQQAELAHAFRLNVAGEMAAALAHELNQPLTAIANYVKAARRRLTANHDAIEDDIVDYVDRAGAQAHRASQIVRQLRAFVEKRQLQYSEEDLPSVVMEAVDLAVVGVLNLRVNSWADSNIPPVKIARVQIQQVVVNLVRNAIEAMQDAADREILIKVERSDSAYAVVSVRDWGEGISDSISNNLFKPFITSKVQGMGIGLSISRTIIENHGGRLWAENSPGKGATFFFDLPLPEMQGEQPNAA